MTFIRPLLANRILEPDISKCTWQMEILENAYERGDLEL